MKKPMMEQDYLRIKQEISKRKLKNVYILTGSEDFLMDEAVSEICTSLLPHNSYSVNISRINGRDCSLEDVLDMAETVSLFGDPRIVVVDDAPYFAKNPELSEESLSRLLALHSSGEQSSCVVFYAADFLKTKKIHKELVTNGAVYYFAPLAPPMITAWLRERLKAYGKTASSHVLTVFEERVGRDLRRLAVELEKLVTYLGEQRELDEKSVLMATARSLQGDIFALTDAVVHRRTGRALAKLKELLACGEPPLRILAMLVRQFRLLGDSLELLGRGCAPDELASRLGIHPYAAKKLALQAEKTNEASLSRAVELLLQADLDIKRGKVSPNLTMETLVVALGQKSA